jgi:hypothetical protein
MTTANNDLPVCVYCCRGTTSKQLVEVWVKPSARQRYYAHAACAARRRGKVIPPDPLINRTRTIPSLAERLAEWNALADELNYLLAQCWSAPRALATANVAVRVWNAVGYRKTDMTWALTDPRIGCPDEAGDQVRILRWHAGKLRAALKRDPGSHSPRKVRGCLPALNLRLPETIEAVREAYKRKALA